MAGKEDGKKKIIGKHDQISLTVNSQEHKLAIGPQRGHVDTSHTLAYTLRETLGLTGTKISCDRGACGCCTVLLDGLAVNSCMVLTIECAGKNITTIEGLADPSTGTLDPLQQAFIDEGAFQCGYCTPGIIMSAKALLMKGKTLTDEKLKEGLSGNFCRCISHYQVMDAVKAAIKKTR